MQLSNYRYMNSDKTSEEKQNELLPPNISWPDVLEGKLTPSEDTTGKWVASTTSFERKGLRFGMESSPASVEVKGSMQAEERETAKKKIQKRVERKRWISKSDNKRRSACRTKVTESRDEDVGWRRWGWKQFTCPCCCHWKPCGTWMHCGLESRLQVKKVTLHLHCAGDRKLKNKQTIQPLF